MADVTPTRVVGRPTKYKKEFVAKAKMLCDMGATDADLALFFDVTVPTIWRWQNEHKEFFNATKVGKDRADESVKRSLYQRARGYTIKSIKIMQDKGEPVIVEYDEFVPGDVNAQRLWLMNRDPDAWRERQEIKHDASDAFLNLWQKIGGGT